MKGSFRLGRIASIEIGVHYTWFLALFLIAWSLAEGLFPQSYPGWDKATYWTIGLLATLLLFGSVVTHEIAHSLVANARGLRVRNITLFIFGGVSNIESEPEQPKVEFAMAIVGPLTSLALAGIFWGLAQVVGAKGTPLAAMLDYLSMVNALLAGFNLLPGFPLDGGRVLRSIIWQTTGDLTKATNIAANVGRVFGWGFMALGVFYMLGGNFLSGLWIAFIGWFLSGSADASRREMTLKDHLTGVRVKDVMNTTMECVDNRTSVDELVRENFIQHGRRAVPICKDTQLIGIVTLTDVKKLPQQKWAQTPVEEIMTRPPLHTVGQDDDLNAAMKLLAQYSLNQVPVLSNGHLVGLLSRADIIRYLQLSQELGMKSNK
ncbi:MAG: site-2 protease family protein [Dehalococcoidales bacterium]|nr:site-2 protease family protein [Dehalococcoidales bacterium]